MYFSAVRKTPEPSTSTRNLTDTSARTTAGISETNKTQIATITSSGINTASSKTNPTASSTTRSQKGKYDQIYILSYL